MVGRVTGTSLVAGMAAAYLLKSYYGIDLITVLVLLGATVVQSLVYFVSAYFQSRQEFLLSTLTFNSSNYTLLGVAALAQAG